MNRVEPNDFSSSSGSPKPNQRKEKIYKPNSTNRGVYSVKKMHILLALLGVGGLLGGAILGTYFAKSCPTCSNELPINELLDRCGSLLCRNTSLFTSVCSSTPRPPLTTPTQPDPLFVDTFRLQSFVEPINYRLLIKAYYSAAQQAPGTNRSATDYFQGRVSLSSVLK
jgi:hypothetical protein